MDTVMQAVLAEAAKHEKQFPGLTAAVGLSATEGKKPITDCLTAAVERTHGYMAQQQKALAVIAVTRALMRAEKKATKAAGKGR